MKEFNLKANIYCSMDVAILAENRKDAERLLNDTIDSITVKEIKEKLSKCKEVEIKESKVVQQICSKEREWER